MRKYLILSSNCSKMVFIGSSFRMNACREIEFPMENGTQIPVDKCIIARAYTKRMILFVFSF